MGILQFFTPNEPIAGLQISDDSLRLVLLNQKKIPLKSSVAKATLKNKFFEKKITFETKIEVATEEKIPEGVVEMGEVINPQVFQKSVSELLKKTKLKVRYCIVSLPANNIYSRHFSFPENISGEKLAETMRIAIEFQIPVKKLENYIDWQKMGENNEIFLGSGNKNMIDKLVSALSGAGLKVVAMEFYPLSISRVLKRDVENSIAQVIMNNDYTTIFITKGSALRFCRDIPHAMSNKEIKEEFGKVISYYESEYHENVEKTFYVNYSNQNIVPDGFLTIDSEVDFDDSFVKKDEGKWLVALGAAKRGITPRSQDRMLSLMPVTTETAYETQKALVFSGLVSNIFVGLAIFLAAAYVGLWMLMVSLQKSVSNQIATLNSIPLPTGAAELERSAIRFNSLVAEAGSISKSIPRWSVVFEELRTQIPAGITVNGFIFPSQNGVFTMSGVASDRGQLKILKKNIEQSQILTVVDLPISNITEKSNIPFLLTFKLKNPEMINYH